MVSERVLLEGAWFALEQCGILLRDAVTLYERASPVTAVGLAMLAREEMGKARILLDFWRDAVNKGRKVSAAEIRRELDRHEEKQRKAQVSQVLTAGEIGTEAGDTRMAKLLRTVTTSGHSAAERETARQELDGLRKKLLKRTPEDRHRLRMTAIYVDLNETETGWSRPSEIQNDARAHIEHVASDYSGHWHRFQHSLEVLAHVEPQLAEALKQWPERPALPEPAWPR